MKKILFIALFSFGMITMSHAQFFTYTLTNSSSTLTWDYKMKDAGSGVTTTELGILPNTSRSGFVFGFAFALEFKAQNSAGCGTYQFVPGTTTGVSVPITCIVPTGLKYKVTAVSAFLTHLELKFG